MGAGDLITARERALIMGRTRHENPRTALRYVKPGPEAITKITEVLSAGRALIYPLTSRATHSTWWVIGY
ncbi:hypothetical protein [Acrocarpospora sp. B8E8]|uniref:hypothetical protein n=1 Tax=Acrocarpospora sp. B8E8 TaxID=3153572 RepID=UPI00325F9570